MYLWLLDFMSDSLYLNIFLIHFTQILHPTYSVRRDNVLPLKFMSNLLMYFSLSGLDVKMIILDSIKLNPAKEIKSDIWMFCSYQLFLLPLCIFR